METWYRVSATDNVKITAQQVERSDLENGFLVIRDAHGHPVYESLKASSWGVWFKTYDEARSCLITRATARAASAKQSLIEAEHDLALLNAAVKPE